MSGRDSLNLKYLKTTSASGGVCRCQSPPKNFFCAGHQIGDISRPHAAQPSATSSGAPSAGHGQPILTVGTPRLAAMNHQFVRPVNPGYRDMAGLLPAPRRDGQTARSNCSPGLNHPESTRTSPTPSQAQDPAPTDSLKITYLSAHLRRRGAWANPHVKKDLGGG